MPTSTLQTMNPTATGVLAAENTYRITGPSTRIGGSCTTATSSTSSAHTPAAGTFAASSPTPASSAWMKATPSTPRATLRTVAPASAAISSPRRPIRRAANARENRRPSSAWASSTPAMRMAATNCTIPMPASAASFSSQPPTLRSCGSSSSTAADRFSEASVQNACSRSPTSGHEATLPEGGGTARVPRSRLVAMRVAASTRLSASR